MAFIVGDDYEGRGTGTCVGILLLDTIIVIIVADRFWESTDFGTQDLGIGVAAGIFELGGGSSAHHHGHRPAGGVHTVGGGDGERVGGGPGRSRPAQGEMLTPLVVAA